MKIRRTLIDVTNCPDEIIQRHLAGTDISFSNYHFNAHQIFISDTGKLHDAVVLIDEYLDKYRDVLRSLNYDEVQTGSSEPIRLTLQIETELGDKTFEECQFPGRLLANLHHTGALLQFC